MSSGRALNLWGSFKRKRPDVREGRPRDGRTNTANQRRRSGGSQASHCGWDLRSVWHLGFGESRQRLRDLGEPERSQVRELKVRRSVQGPATLLRISSRQPFRQSRTTRFSRNKFAVLRRIINIGNR
jgi:hypothetical protein